ncbi:hypothetical protein BJ165DRAFT_1405003 [Panaeolus papilionaceus]|nr:hypothetical protein BJ165DRAFT_1405003 [Panaeolus papilionaceus]
MFAKATFTFFVAALASLQGKCILFSLLQRGAFALTAKIGSDGPQANRLKIDNALIEANDKLTKMTAFLNGPSPGTQKAFTDAFGTNANIAEIKKRVAAIYTGNIVIYDAEASPLATQGATDVSVTPPKIYFGSVFYSSTTSIEDAAGTIIHEASHALVGTTDYFYPTGKPYLKGDPVPADKVKAGVLVGYKDSNLKQLIQIASAEMHNNADSYPPFESPPPQGYSEEPDVCHPLWFSFLPVY